MIKRLEKILSTVAFNPERLQLELTETSYLDDHDEVINNIKELEPSVQGYNRVWVIFEFYNYESSSDPKGLIKQKMSQSYNLEDYKIFMSEYEEIQVYLFENS